MRKLLTAAMAAALMGLAAPAFAGPGPAGTSEGGSGATNDDQVHCGTADDDDIDAGNGVMVKTVGDQAAPQDGGALVVCNDGTAAPIQGRVIATGGASGGWIAADGDADNPSQAQGYAKVTINAGTSSPVVVRCGNTAAKDTDSANQDGAGKLCGS